MYAICYNIIRLCIHIIFFDPYRPCLRFFRWLNIPYHSPSIPSILKLDSKNIVKRAIAVPNMGNYWQISILLNLPFYLYVRSRNFMIWKNKYCINLNYHLAVVALSIIIIRQYQTSPLWATGKLSITMLNQMLMSNVKKPNF